MTIRVSRSAIVLLILALLSACGARTGSPSPAAPAQPPAADPSQRIWDELATAARAEGKLVLATNSVSVRESVAPAFKQRFGVDVEIITGRGSETVARIMRERAAGIATVDVLISGLGSVASELYPNKGIASIKSLLVVPEVSDPSKWRDGKIKFNDPDDEYVLRSMESVQNQIIIAG